MDDNLAVIPARGGSKRIPKKNIKKFGGHPLITWTINAAQESEIFDRIIVTTDDYETRRVAMIYGAEVYERDKELAGDHVPVSRATIDVVKSIGWKGNVAQLLPTCPLRNAEDIVESHWAFVSGVISAQISVADYGWQQPGWAVHRGCGGRASFLMENFRLSREDINNTRSQDMGEYYCPTGAIWWASVHYLLKYKTFYGDEFAAWRMPRHRAVDIDTVDDWRVADAFRRYAK